MTIIEALTLCKDGGHKVRPVCWQTLNRSHWVEFRALRRSLTAARAAILAAEPK